MSQLAPVVIADVVAAVIMISVGAFAWRRRSVPGATPFTVLTFAIALWMLANAFFYEGDPLEVRLFWNRIKFLGVDITGAAWLAFALAYAGRSAWFTPRNLILLSSVPLVSNVLHWARDLSPGFSPTYQLDTLAVVFPLGSAYDAWYPLHLAYTYLVVGIGTVILIHTFASRSSGLYRSQLLALLVGVMAPWAADIPITFGLIAPDFELSPFALALSGVAFGFALFRYQLFDIAPAAHAAVIANLADGLLVLDTRDRIVEVNPAALRVLGRQADQVVGKSIREVLPNVDVGGQLPAGTLLSLSEVGACSGQGQRHFEVHTSLVHSRRGRPSGRIILLHDVTHRVDAEETLRQRAAQLEALGRVESEISAQMENLDHLLRFIAEQAIRLMNGVGGGVALYQPEQDALQYVVTIGPYAPPPGVLRRRGEGIAGQVWQTGQPIILDDYQSWQGRVRNYEGSPPRAILGVPIRWGQEFLGVLVVFAYPPHFFSPADADLLAVFAAHAAIAIRNVRLMQSLRDSEKRFREMADALPEAVFETDAQGRFTFVNKRAFELFGYTVQDFESGLNASQMIVAAERERFARNLEEALRGAEVSNEYTALRKDGTTFPSLVRSRAIYQNGQPVGLRGILIDITEQKRAEQSMQRSLYEKETLLKEIHHRVKNNLQIVSSLLYLQAELIADDKARTFLEESQNRVKSLAMIHEQLYLSPDLVNIDFTRYVHNLAAYLFDAYMVDPDAIKLIIDVSEGLSFSVDVATPCGLIINELLSNAVKHAFPDGATSPSGQQPEVRISLHPVDSERYVLVISDNGVGMPAEIDQGHTPSLGMQIVDVLTKQLKAQVEVDGRQGTTVKITFPGSLRPKSRSAQPPL